MVEEREAVATAPGCVEQLAVVREVEEAAHQSLLDHRNLAIRVFTWTFSLFTLHRFTDCTNGFRAYKTSILRDPRIDWSQDWLHSYELEYYIHYKVRHSATG